MQILLVYGTNEGQTQKIAAFVADRLARCGHQVTTASASDAQTPPDPHRFEAVLVAASVHLGRYQPAVIDFVRRHHAAISARSNAFLSVSLSAAGRESDDRRGLQKCVADFVQATGWAPELVHHVAGAFRYTTYGFLTRCVMKYIAWRKGAPTDTHHDYELTDWEDVARFTERFAAAEAITRA
ncbi:MAG TPA: flavodoxin domain-containing protein [Steroidobacteraceae bacterium]|nr:flavodoxin domain-containing protein [Steroidobacteraceae bacterium]